MGELRFSERGLGGGGRRLARPASQVCARHLPFATPGPPAERPHAVAAARPFPPAIRSGASALLSPPECFPTHLRRVDECVRLAQHRRHRVLLGQARRHDGLRGKGRVPQLRAVVPVHLHPVLSQPQVVEKARQVRAEAVAHRVFPEATDGVDGLVDWADVDEARRVVLVRDQSGAPPERTLAQPARHPRLESRHHRPQTILQHRVLGVHVLWTAVVAVRLPLHLLVRLRVELRAQRLHHRRPRARGAPAVQVRHGQIDHSAVAPEAPGVDNQPVWEDPHLRWQRVEAPPLVHAEHCQPELGPRGVVHRAAARVHKSARAHAVRLRGGEPEQPRSHIVEAGAEHGGVAFDVKADAAVGILVVPEVPQQLETVRLRKLRLSHVTRNHEAGQQEHGPAVVTRPVAALHLQRAVEADAAAQGRLNARRLACASRRRHTLPPLAARRAQALQPVRLVRRMVAALALDGVGGAVLTEPLRLPRLRLSRPVENPQMAA